MRDRPRGAAHRRISGRDRGRARRGGSVLAAGARQRVTAPDVPVRCRASSRTSPGDRCASSPRRAGRSATDERLSPAGSRRGAEGGRDRHLARRRGRSRRGRPAARLGRDRQGRGRDPAPHAGLIAKLHGAVGDIVQTGAPLVAFADAPEADTGAIVGEIEPRTPAAARHRASVGGRPAARRRAGELGVDIAKVEGTGPEARSRSETSRRRRAATPPVAPSRCAGVRGRWRATWRARMRRGARNRHRRGRHRRLEGGR